MKHSIKGNIVDIHQRRIYGGRVHWETGTVAGLVPDGMDHGVFILPGFVDAHIHIESSMVTPYEFARVALAHGTVATVSDPHEIANVCGLAGVEYMIQNAAGARLKFHFGAPSCVPATAFETAGAVLDSGDVGRLLDRKEILFLSEMMNYPGVLSGDAEVMEKIRRARAAGKPVDGHAPGLRGEEAARYIAAGISTDHECVARDEALDKLAHGMHILIREGSAARNFEALHSLISEYPEKCMLCSDDRHPDDLMAGHINAIVARAVAKGHSLFDVLRCASLNPVMHYRLPVGLLRPGDPADFIVVRDLAGFEVLATYVNGECMAENGRSVLPQKKQDVINRFACTARQPADFSIAGTSAGVRAIEAQDGQLITRDVAAECLLRNGFLEPDVGNDVLKIAVVNRYVDAKPAVAFIRNFGLRRGAIASTVAHDSHNIIAVGCDDESICRAVNRLVENKGGLACVNGAMERVIALPIGGLMSDKSCAEIARAYQEIDRMAKDLGSMLRAPFMTLSFMALLVIPDLKLSDKGLFSGKEFRFVGV